MKIENLTESDVKFLSDLKNKLNTQDTWGTADPYWCIEYKKRIYNVIDDSCVGSIFYEKNAPEVNHESFDELLDCIKENIEEYNFDKDDLEKLNNAKELDDLPDSICDDFEECFYTEEYFYEGCFLTPEGANDYLNINKHNIPGYDIHVYCKSNFRNFQILNLINIIKKIDITEIDD